MLGGVSCNVHASIDVNNALETYGTGTKGANRYEFVDFPNPGGLPQIGNSSFSITVQATGGNPITASWMMIGSARLHSRASQ